MSALNTQRQRHNLRPQVLTCSHLNPGTRVFSMPYKEVVFGWLGQILEMEKAIRESLKVHLFLGG